MGDQALLSVGAAILVAAIAAPASAAQGTPAVRPPERLTGGAANQFLGVLSARGDQLYYVSDEASTTQMYVQDMGRGIPRLLFDEIADVSWPRPSPDGRRLLYISYRTDAAGDLCVRELPAGERRCLTDERTAEVQAIWLPGGTSIALVTRAGLHGDFELRRISLDGTRGDLLAAGNLSSPAVSPDGRWLAFVPVERGSPMVGPSFLARSPGSLAFARLEPGAPRPAERVALDLPGASASPAFSHDGKWVYFTQYFNDTNLDGAIDGRDNGVLFRAPFSGGKLGAPEQLTSARQSCQYPEPAADRLIATCQAQGSLDVYSLPLDGGVPPGWGPERIDDEMSATSDRWVKLLLLAHRGGSPQVLAEMIRLHLELGEYESALFYADRLSRSDATAGAALRELAGHRREERALSRGMLSSSFVRDARARLERLGRVGTPLAALVRSEVLDTLGDEEAARAGIDRIEPADPLVAWLYGERLLALYRGEPRFFELYRPLAERDLDHADAFVRELLHGSGAAGRARLAETWLGRVDPDSELAFLLTLERALADLTPGTQEPVRERIFQLYRKNKEFARRRELVHLTVQRGMAEDSEFLVYNFANSWVSYVPRERAARRPAERLFRDVVLERAYVEESRKNIGNARGHYFAVTLQTDALEADAGFIEMRLREGKDPASDYARKPELARRYARAYLVARALPADADLARHERNAEQAIAELQALAGVPPQRPEVHHLWAFVAHQRWLRTGDRLSAVEANAHALLALDLAADNPRERAAILELLGRLQSSVGNHAIAIGWLEERSKLPFTGNLSRFAHGLALARARFHIGEPAGAAAEADLCLAIADRDLRRLRPVALDRSAFYHLAAGEPAVAAQRYAALWPLVAAASGAEGARNRLTTQVGWAAAELGAGRAAAALEHVAAAEKILASAQPAPYEGAYGRARPPHDAIPGDYGLLLAGLRGQAHLLAGQLAEADVALTRRRDGIAARLARTEVDEDRLDLAAAEAQLALVAYRQGAADRALGHLQQALRQWDAWSASTNTPVEELGLAVLAGLAELHLLAGVPLGRLGVNLPERLRASFALLSQSRNPAWEPMRSRFEIFLTMLSLRRNP